MKPIPFPALHPHWPRASSIVLGFCFFWVFLIQTIFEHPKYLDCLFWLAIIFAFWVGRSWISSIAASLLVFSMLYAFMEHRIQNQTANKASIEQIVSAKQVGLALEFYSKDHDGKLPNDLEALVPDCISTQEALSKMTTNFELVASGQNLEKLPAKTVIIRQKNPDRTGRILIVYADMSAEFIQP